MGTADNGVVRRYLCNYGNSEYLFRFLFACTQPLILQFGYHSVYDADARLSVPKELRHLRRSAQGRHIGACDDDRFVSTVLKHESDGTTPTPGEVVYNMLGNVAHGSYIHVELYRNRPNLYVTDKYYQQLPENWTIYDLYKLDKEYQR